MTQPNSRQQRRTNSGRTNAPAVESQGRQQKHKKRSFIFPAAAAVGFCRGSDAREGTQQQVFILLVNHNTARSFSPNFGVGTQLGVDARRAGRCHSEAKGLARPPAWWRAVAWLAWAINGAAPVALPGRSGPRRRVRPARSRVRFPHSRARISHKGLDAASPYRQTLCSSPANRAAATSKPCWRPSGDPLAPTDEDDWTARARTEWQAAN